MSTLTSQEQQFEQFVLTGARGLADVHHELLLKCTVRLKPAHKRVWPLSKNAFDRLNSSRCDFRSASAWRTFAS